LSKIGKKSQTGKKRLTLTCC